MQLINIIININLELKYLKYLTLWIYKTKYDKIITLYLKF